MRRRRLLRFGAEVRVFRWGRAAVVDLQAFGSLVAAAGLVVVGQVGEADPVAGERGRPFQLVHGHADGVA